MLANPKKSEEMEDTEENVSNRMKLQMTNRINRFQNGKIVTKAVKQTHT